MSIAGLLLIADGDQGGGLLRVGKPGFADAPKLPGAHTGRQAGLQPVPVDQPLRLRVAADNGSG